MNHINAVVQMSRHRKIAHALVRSVGPLGVSATAPGPRSAGSCMVERGPLLPPQFRTKPGLDQWSSAWCPTPRPNRGRVAVVTWSILPF